MSTNNNYIPTIGFQNFRRFATFPSMLFGDITVLVGGNNSGKSTIVKALLLCVDNLRLMRMSDRRRSESNSFLSFSKPLFRFDASELHDVKIKEFARAIHNKPVIDNDSLSVVKTKKKSLPTSMKFEFILSPFQFTFVVSGNRDERSTYGDVDRILIEDLESHVRYTNDYSGNYMSYEVLNADADEELSLTRKLVKDLKDAQTRLQKANDEGDLEAITDITSSLDKIKMQISSMLNLDEDKEYEFTERELETELFNSLLKGRNPYKALYDDLPLSISYNEVNEPVVLNVISNIINFATSKGVAPKDNGTPNDYAAAMEEFSLMEGYRKAIKQDIDVLNQSKRKLSNLLNTLSVEYISAHAANQNTIYNTGDLNDYIAQTVHGFWRERIAPGDYEYEFVREWMQKFEIGIDFKIDALVPGEAYTVTITEESGSVVPLADKGMGSIQMMILLLRIATILYKNKQKDKNGQFDWITSIIVIEEPEQNLHPKMQSYLADLFHFLAKWKRIRMLIETHSEYLIRKSQVIVANEKFEDDEDLRNNNLFKVYYLPSDDTVPYEMKYRTDGKFSNEFGTGFFDEANNLLFDIL